jgi:hypothetical protein
MKDGCDSKTAGCGRLLNRKIFLYKGDGKFGESLRLSVDKNKDLSITVCAADELVDENYCEPGPAVMITLPVEVAQELIMALVIQYRSALMTQYPEFFRHLYDTANRE